MCQTKPYVLCSFRDQIHKDIQERQICPKLVGFLANEDPAAKKYAEWTAKTCAETGVAFELRKVDKQDLEEKITEANEDKDVNGIMVYYPVFGGKQVYYCMGVYHHVAWIADRACV